MADQQHQPLMQEMQTLEWQPSPEKIKSHIENTRFSRFSNRLSRLSRFTVDDFSTALHYIRETWKSGMSQAIINIPLVLNMGYASGMTGGVGLMTAFIAAFVNGFLSGSNHSIYMPSSIVPILLIQIQKEYGQEIIPWVTLISGLLIYCASLMKWHRLSDYMPDFVIEGYFLGVAFFFIVRYSDYAFGLADLGTVRGYRQYPNVVETYYNLILRGNVFYFLLSISVFLFLQISRNVNRAFPSVLITTCFGLFMGVLFPTEKCLHSVYGGASFHFSFLGMPPYELTYDILLDLAERSLPIACSVTVQNLLCARGAQNLTGVKCDYDQETFCVSVANIVCGICGGIPCCAATRMYTLDIKMRETNRWASIINALSIVLFYGLFSTYFLQIPFYIVSGQIYFNLYQQLPLVYLTKLYKTKRRLTFCKCLIVGWVCYSYGPVYSAIIGSLHSLFIFAQKMSAAASEIIVNTEQAQSQIRFSLQDAQNEKIQEDDLPDQSLKGSYTLYRFTGAVNYINIKNHLTQINQLADTDFLIFSFRYVSVFDESAIDKLSHYIDNKQKKNHEIILTGLHRGMIEEMKHNEFFKEFFDNHLDKYKTLGS